jgi:hypothetical protein
MRTWADNRLKSLLYIIQRIQTNIVFLAKILIRMFFLKQKSNPNHQVAFAISFKLYIKLLP